MIPQLVNCILYLVFTKKLACMSLGYKDLWEAEIRYPEFGFDFLATFPVKRHLRDQRYSAPFSV